MMSSICVGSTSAGHSGSASRVSIAIAPPSELASRSRIPRTVSFKSPDFASNRGGR